MVPFVIVDAPSVLGLRPSGVEDLPEALKAAGLQAGLKADYAGRVEPPPYNAKRDPETLVLNPNGLRDYARQLAETGEGSVAAKQIPRRSRR